MEESLFCVICTYKWVFSWNLEESKCFTGMLSISHVTTAIGCFLIPRRAWHFRDKAAPNQDTESCKHSLMKNKYNFIFLITSLSTNLHTTCEFCLNNFDIFFWTTADKMMTKRNSKMRVLTNYLIQHQGLQKELFIFFYDEGNVDFTCDA